MHFDDTRCHGCGGPLDHGSSKYLTNNHPDVCGHLNFCNDRCFQRSLRPFLPDGFQWDFDEYAIKESAIYQSYARECATQEAHIRYYSKLEDSYQTKLYFHRGKATRYVAEGPELVKAREALEKAKRSMEQCLKFERGNHPFTISSAVYQFSRHHLDARMKQDDAELFRRLEREQTKREAEQRAERERIERLSKL